MSLRYRPAPAAVSAPPTPASALQSTKGRKESLASAKPSMPTAPMAGPAIKSGRRPQRSAALAAGMLHAMRASAEAAVTMPSSLAVSPAARARIGSTGIMTP